MSHLLTTRNPQSEARRQAVHGPIEPAYNPRKDLGWGMVCKGLAAFVALYFALSWFIGWQAGAFGAMPSALAVAASPSNPSVSPLRASIRIAGENNGRH